MQKKISKLHIVNTKNIAFIKNNKYQEAIEIKYKDKNNEVFIYHLPIIK